MSAHVGQSFGVDVVSKHHLCLLRRWPLRPELNEVWSWKSAHMAQYRLGHPILSVRLSTNSCVSASHTTEFAACRTAIPRR